MKMPAGKRDVWKALSQVLRSGLWWCLIVPLTIIVPRDRSLLIFYGRDGGKFVDNCKHLFCGATPEITSAYRLVYVATDELTVNQIRLLGREAVTHGSASELWLWLRAGIAFVDSVDWTEGWRYAASRGSRVVQMWHGIPLKHVQMARVRSRRALPGVLEAAYRRYLRLSGRHVHTEYFLSTSPFVTESAFSNSFNFDFVSHAGYPRNDALFVDGNPLRMVNVDQRALDAALRYKARGGVLGIYAPTFRNSLVDPFQAGNIDLVGLSKAAVGKGILLLVKLHPWMHGWLKSVDHPGLLFVRPDSDIYPLLPVSDFLATDYSSIFFDYLLLDRPVIFFPYDLERYLTQERAMYFDYFEFTPGDKAFTLDNFSKLMGDVVAGVDGWADGRKRVRDLVFSHQDGSASARVFEDVLHKY